MSQAPDLLNDDGTASMATALLMSHHGLRRDLARFELALQRLGEGGPSAAAALLAEWQRYRSTLHGHHEAEDNGLFPHVASQRADLRGVIDELTSDHRRIDPLLEQGDRAFADLASRAAEAALVVFQLSALLDKHLATEEAQVVPFLRGAKGFPPPATAAEAEMFADGFAWASHGVADDVVDRVFAMLPEVISSRMPGARAAFAERCARVWGPTPPGASRTAVPDWLAAR
jgi:hemerythrin-like domain-containing protein